jgi:hypothetical protein
MGFEISRGISKPIGLLVPTVEPILGLTMSSIYSIGFRRLLGSILVLALGSCGAGRKPCFPVQGQVFAGEGKARVPATGAMVVLTPQGSTKEGDPHPYARVGEDGKFVVSTYGTGDGAPTGEYVITIHWADRPPRPRDLKNQVDKLKGQYGDPQKVEIAYSVEKRKDNVVPPIELP